MKNALGIIAGAVAFLVIATIFSTVINGCDVDKKVYNITDADTTIVIVCPHNPPCRERCR